MQSVSIQVGAGDVLAVMGPSGAGKTILLSMITLERGPGTPYGAVTLNGRPLTIGMYTQYFAFVPKEFVLWATLTVRQHLEFATNMCRPHLSGAEAAAAVDALLVATGMESCQNTKAGDRLRKGLSGDQRRRLSLAIALVKQPKVLILDEPSSGLDSAAAAAIVSFLKGDFLKIIFFSFS